MLINRFFQIQNFENFVSLKDFFQSKGFTSQQIQIFFSNQMVFVNEKKASPQTRPLPGMRIQIFLNDAEKEKYFATNSLKILHCDDNFLVVNKPYGITVSSDFHHKTKNVVFFLKDWLNFSKSSPENASPVIHRLDKPTTGIFLLSRNLNASKKLKFLIKKRMIKRKYLAIVKGQIKKKEFIIKAPLLSPGKRKRAEISFAGKIAETHIKVLKQKKEYALIECELKTGRTHQIRSHLKFLGHPILNDFLYSNDRSDFLFLNSYKITFSSPFKNNKFHFEIPIPSFFNKKLMKE